MTSLAASIIPDISQVFYRLSWPNQQTDGQR